MKIKIISFFIFIAFFTPSKAYHYTTEDVHNLRNIAFVSTLTPSLIMLLFGKDGKKDLQRLSLASNEILKVLTAALEDNHSYLSLTRTVKYFARAYKEGILLMDWSDYGDWPDDQIYKVRILLTALVIKEMWHMLAEYSIKRLISEKRLVRRTLRIIIRALIEGIIDSIAIFAKNKFNCNVDDSDPQVVGYHSFLNTLGKETVYELFGEIIQDKANDQSIVLQFDNVPSLEQFIELLEEVEKNQKPKSITIINNKLQQNHL